MKILVAGAGAIGCLVGGRLAAIGCEVILLGRSTWVNAINARGLHLEWPDGRQQTVHPQAITNVATLQDPGDIDLVLVTPKSFATTDVVAGLVQKLKLTARILSLQNGVGNEDRLASVFPENPILAGSITIPVAIPQAGTIIVSKEKGGIGLAPYSAGGMVADIADRFREAGFTTVTYMDHRSLKWSKLLMNIVSNASSAILDMSPGESLTNPAIFDLEIAAMRETLAVMKAQGIAVVDFPDYPLRLLAFVLRWLPNSFLRPILRSVMIGSRGDKLPSLQLDLRQGRTDSEIEVLNGVVACVGQARGVPVPVNHTLSDVLGGIVSGQLSWETYQRKPAVLLAAVQKYQP